MGLLPGIGAGTTGGTKKETGTRGALPTGSGGAESLSSSFGLGHRGAARWKKHERLLRAIGGGEPGRFTKFEKFALVAVGGSVRFPPRSCENLIAANHRAISCR